MHERSSLCHDAWRILCCGMSSMSQGLELPLDDAWISCSTRARQAVRRCAQKLWRTTHWAPIELRG